MTAPDHIQQQKINRITDQVKRTFFTVSSELAQLQWGLATMAGRGELSPYSNDHLQANIVDAFQEMNSCLMNIVDRICDDEGSEETYGDDTKVGTKVRHDDVSADWPHDEFLLDDGAVAEFPYGTIWQPNPLPSYDTADEDER